jgi:hypothetical protein
MRTTIATMVVVMLGGLSAWAQSAGSGFSSTVAGVAGVGKTWDDEGQIGTGPLFGARADRRLFGNTFAEVSVDYLRHERTGRFSAEGRTILVTGSLMQRFGEGRTQPYALGGVALARHVGTFGFPEANISSNTESTGPGFVFGGGMAIGVRRRYEVGPEARFLVISSGTDSGPAYACWIGVRFGVRS